MSKKENCYEILGLRSEIINWTLHQDTDNLVQLIQRKEEQKNKIIKNSYESQLKILQYGIDRNINNPHKIKEIKEKIKELTTAYETIKSEPLRIIYNRELERRKINKERPLIHETAYNFFGISERNIKMYPENRANSLIESAYKKMIKECNKVLENEKIGFKEKNKIEYIITKATRYYHLIDTSNNRTRYEKFLNRKEQEAKEEYRKELIKEKYSKKNYYNKGLINTNEKGEKKVIRKEKKEVPYIVLKNGNDIVIRKTAEIVFENFTGALESNVGEYEVRRTIEGEEKVDIIYTDLLLSELGINKKTGRPINSQYYSCVANKLLTEDMIEGSKYNDGYIGLIEKKENGEYSTTLGEEELSPIEQEMMTAVMISKENKQKTRNMKAKEEGR